ncbi:MAG: RNA-binding protein [Gammaproteobacteria bacterium]|nr:RNA-binding protein [Gammaproteobacteria bacterium]
MESKLYVGNLSYSTTEDELRQLFSQAGNVKSVSVIKDRDTGRSKGFAFVEMGSDDEAQKAISQFNGQNFQDRSLKINVARPREDRPRGGGGFGGPRGGGGGDRGGFGGPRGGGGGGDRGGRGRSW